MLIVHAIHVQKQFMWLECDNMYEHIQRSNWRKVFKQKWIKRVQCKQEFKFKDNRFKSSKAFTNLTERNQSISSPKHKRNIKAFESKWYIQLLVVWFSHLDPCDSIPFI